MQGTLKLTAAFSLFALSSLAASPAWASILPPNDLHLRDNPSILANMTEEQFNDIINEVVAIYKPLAAAQGATLKTNNLWSNTTVNASAQQNGNEWIINMYGGLARRAEVTPDGFAMVVCHELGHHFGGFVFYGNNDWASSEGQSDYFATQSCARQIWRSQLAENAAYASEVTGTEKQKCDGTWSTGNDRNLCYRTVAAGKSLATLLSALNNGGVPKTDTPDRTQVRTTLTSHPQAQCRLDTYFAGSLCKAEFDENVIPARNHPSGQTSIAAEEVAAQSSCMAATGWVSGNRPRCWFAPKMDFQALRFGSTDLRDKGNGNGAADPGESLQVRFALSNGTQTATTNVTGVLSTPTAGVSIVGAQARWPDLPVGSDPKFSNEAFAVQLAPTLKCGQTFDLELAASSAQGQMTISKTFLVGKLVESALGANETRTEIPDNDKAGIESTISSEKGGNATSAKVELAIAHPFPSDLTISLVSPEGTEARVYPQQGTSLAVLKASKGLRKALAKGLAQGIYQTFDVQLATANSKGDWKLKVIDKAARDVGTLEKWGLTLSKAECAGPSAVASK
ncbi:MAG: proprotein convertase P-domain-containing protein [Silvanigrellales bacterium]|nr:proprotein convertase P-domain-containing protein [Silvanigrellales bacterium]